MNFERISDLVASMATMKYFPGEPAARLALVQLMGELTDSEEQVRWLVHEARAKFSEWPGEQELRKIFVGKFRPKDGRVPSICSCGCGAVTWYKLAPGQQWPKQIAAAEMKALPPGKDEPVSESPEFVEVISDLAAAMPVMPKAKPGNDRFPRLLKETLTAPADRPILPKTPQIITQADIDRAVDELHAKQWEAMRTDANPSEPMRSYDDPERQEKQERRSA